MQEIFLKIKEVRIQTFQNFLRMNISEIMMSEKKRFFFNEIMNFINPDWEKEFEIKKVCIEYLYFTLLNIPGPYMDVYSDEYDENCAIRCTMYHLFIMAKDQSMFFGEMKESD